MKTTFRLVALLSVAALAACADAVTGPAAQAPAVTQEGQGFMGGGTREQP